MARGAEPPPSVASPDPVVLLDAPTRVEARMTTPDPDGQAYEFEITVGQGRERYRLTTMLLLSDARGDSAAWAALRGGIGWRDGYLFVRTECGAGNAWKCSAETVFARRYGHLVALGSLLARAERRPGTCWDGRIFQDYDADLEFVDGMCHACSPGFPIWLVERNGRLVADRERTWAQNARFAAANDSLARANPTPPADGTAWDSWVTPRLANACLARYCGREAELLAWLAEVRRVASPKLFAEFQKPLALVKPGALPRTSRGPAPLRGR